jgi:hypothetical protein
VDNIPPLRATAMLLNSAVRALYWLDIQYNKNAGFLVSSGSEFAWCEVGKMRAAQFSQRD